MKTFAKFRGQLYLVTITGLGHVTCIIISLWLRAPLQLRPRPLPPGPVPAAEAGQGEGPRVHEPHRVLLQLRGRAVAGGERGHGGSPAVGAVTGPVIAAAVAPSVLSSSSVTSVPILKT